MRVVIASDHAGLNYKNLLVPHLQKKGYEITDLGTYEPGPDDYPDYAIKVAVAIQDGKADRGIVICGSGVGISVAVNKFRGIRSAICHDTYSAHQGVEHDDMNVLCMGARVIGTELMFELAETFLQSKFSGEDRHVRRLNKIKDIEAKNFR